MRSSLQFEMEGGLDKYQKSAILSKTCQILSHQMVPNLEDQISHNFSKSPEAVLKGNKTGLTNTLQKGQTNILKMFVSNGKQ